jgi:hypothetical protein
MTDRQLNYLRMVVTNRGFMDVITNAPIWNTNLKASGAKAAVNTIYLQLLADAGLQESDITGTTLDKNLLWKDAADLALHVCIGVRAYAEDVPNWVLFNMMHYTITDLGYGDIQDCITRMGIIFTQAGLILPADLLSFNVTGTNITDLGTFITDLTAAFPLHGVMQASKTAATADVIASFPALRLAMRKQDNIFHTYRLLHGTFVSGYDISRRIADLGKTMKAEAVVMHPTEHVALFKDGFLPTDTFTIRNHSALASIRATLSDDTNPALTGGFVIGPDLEFKMAIATDFKCPFGHNLILEVLGTMDDADVTVILAKGKSDSKAPSPPAI